MEMAPRSTCVHDPCLILRLNVSGNAPTVVEWSDLLRDGSAARSSQRECGCGYLQAGDVEEASVVLRIRQRESAPASLILRQQSHLDMRNNKRPAPAPASAGRLGKHRTALNTRGKRVLTTLGVSSSGPPIASTSNPRAVHVPRDTNHSATFDSTGSAVWRLKSVEFRARAVAQTPVHPHECPQTRRVCGALHF